MLIFLHYYRKMKYFLFYNCLKVSSNPACFGEGFTRSEVADPDDQITFYQIIEDIVRKENAVKEKLAAFDKSGVVDRTDMADEIEKIQKRVEDSIEAARVRIN
jgi:hypothetical protein